MLWVAVWIFLAVLVGILAHNRGRVGFGWFMLSLLFSPALIGLLVLVLRDVSKLRTGATLANAPADDSPTTRCHECRELVRADARKCKHCGSALTPLTTPAARILLDPVRPQASNEKTAWNFADAPDGEPPDKH